MTTAHYNDQTVHNKMIAGSTKAQKMRELSELLDELFAIKEKLKKSGDAKNDGKQ